MNPLVSVVMPVFNGEAFLAEAVDSILRQTYTDFEFIIVNDGSTDRTSTILASYHDNRILLITNTSNVGITKTLNTGIARACGTYVCRMDADDIALPDRIKQQIDFLDANRTIAILGSNTYLIDAAGNEIDKEIYPQSSHDIARAMFIHNPFAHSTVVIRKSVLDECGSYDERFLHNEDYDLWLRITAKHPAMNLPEFLLKRRIHGKNITIAKKSELILFRRRTIAHAISHYYHNRWYSIYLIRPFFAYWWSRLKGLWAA